VDHHINSGLIGADPSRLAKESLRFHPAVYANYRVAARDDVLPLSRPIRATNGQVLDQLPIGKGTKLVLSLAGYNR